MMHVFSPTGSAQQNTKPMNCTRFNHVATGRAVRMIALQQEVNELAAQLVRPHPYPLAFVDTAAQAIVRTTLKES